MPPVVIASNFAVSGANDYVTTSTINEFSINYGTASIAPVVDLECYKSTMEQTCEDLSKSDLVSPTRVCNELPLASRPSIRGMTSEAFYRSCFKTITSLNSSRSPIWHENVSPDDSNVSDISYNHCKNKLPDLLRRLRPIS